VNVLDNEGAVPLHMAARSGNARVVSLLLDNGGLVTAVTFKSTYGCVSEALF
jgi:ankyrin repeat protein